MELNVVFNPLRPFEAAKAADPFPTDCLPPEIKEFVLAVAESIQVSPDMPAALSLAVMSVALQGKAKIRYNASFVQELNTYICIVADPAERKTPVFNAMTAPINNYVKEYNAAHAAEIQGYEDMKAALAAKKQRLISGGKSREEISEVSRELAELKPCYPLKPITTDTTSEALAAAMARNNECIGILSDEGGVLDVAAGLYSDGRSNVNIYLNSYDGQSIIIERKSGSITLKRPLLTVGICAQQIILDSMLRNAVFTGRGFTQRFLYSMPPSLVGQRTLTTENDSRYIAARAEYQKLIYRLMRLPLADESVFITLSPEAAAFFGEFADEIEKKLGKGGEFEEIRDYFGKFTGRALRIAGLLHLAGGGTLNEQVDRVTMCAAIKIAKYFIQQSKSILCTEEQENKQALQVIERIIRLGWKEKRVSFRDLRHSLSRSKLSDEQLQDALDVLTERGYIAEIPFQQTQHNGRKKPSYAINPRIGEHCSRIEQTLSKNPNGEKTA